MKKQLQKGFTLIELMIVVAIIGILAAVGLPAYQDYTIRAQASEGPALSGGLKTGVAEYYADKGYFPVDNDMLLGTGAPAPSGSYVSGIFSSTGILTVVYGNKAHKNITNEALVIVPALSGNNDINWVCGRSAVPLGSVTVEPTQVVGDNTTQSNAGLATTVLDKYLPSSCKL